MEKYGTNVLIPFMGRELTIRVQFAYDPTIVTDQFPTARIIENTPDGAVIEFISQETPGLKRWLLSQADALTVLSPATLVNDMKNFLKECGSKIMTSRSGGQILSM